MLPRSRCQAAALRLALLATSGAAFLSAASWMGCGGGASSHPEAVAEGSDATVTGAGPGADGASPDLDAADGASPDLDAAGDGSTDVCLAYANALCATSERCTGLSPGPECDVWKRTANEQQCRGALAAPGTGETPSLVVKCTASLGTMSCSDYFKDKRDPSCSPRGTFPDGRPCSYDPQCAAGRCARGAGQCGACAAPSAEGARCNDATSGFYAGCVEGAVCLRTSPGSPLVCVGYAGLSESCGPARSCGKYLYCVGGTCIHSSGAGPCARSDGDNFRVPCAAPLLTLDDGIACACVVAQPLNAVCTKPSCAAGTYCAFDGVTPGQGHCQTTAAEGQPCALSIALSITNGALRASACTNSEQDYCSATFDAGGSCSPAPGAGQPCTRAVDLSAPDRNRCAPGILCNQASNPHTCTAPLKVGDPCSAATFWCPADAYCDGTCKSNPTTGQPCGQIVAGRFVVCSAGLFCSSGTCAPLPKIGEACGDVPQLAVRCADAGLCQVSANDAATCVSVCQ